MTSEGGLATSRVGSNSATARADTVPQVLERLAAAGLAQAYRVELPTAPLDGLAAAKIVVPGLEPLTEG